MKLAGLSLDAGALIALERGDRRIIALLDRSAEGTEVHVVAGVVAQVWRSGARQARIARLLKAPNVVVPPLDEITARAVGEICTRTGHSDVVDVHVVLNARENGHVIVTSDEDDLRKVDRSARLIVL